MALTSDEELATLMRGVEYGAPHPPPARVRRGSTEHVVENLGEQVLRGRKAAFCGCRLPKQGPAWHSITH